LRQAESLREGLGEVLSATIDLLGADMGDVQLLNENGRLNVAVQLGFERDFLEYSRVVDVEDQTAFARTLRSGKPTVVEDIELDTAFAPYCSAARGSGFRAVVSAPLIGRYGTLLGIVSTYFRSPHRPSDTDMQRLDLYQRRAADFIERFKSDEALRDSNAKLAAEKKATAKFYEAGLRVLQAQSVSEALDIMISGSIELLGADMGIIQLLDRDGKLSRVAAQQGFTQDILESFFETSDADDNSRGRALRSGIPAVIEDIEADEAYAPFRATARKAGYRAIIAAPLVGRLGVPQGIMVLHYRSSHRPSDADLEHLELYRRRGGDFLERFKAEETLRKSEERLAAILNALPIGVGLFDQAGRFIFRNPVLQQFTNDSIPTHDDPALWQLFDSSGRRLEANEHPSARALRGEVPPEADKLTTVGAEERWIRVRAIPILRNEEALEGLVITQDITQSKQAEIALRESEERSRLAVASSRMGMWDWDARTGTYFWNEENYRLLGYRADEMKPDRAAWAARVHPEDLAAADAAAASARRERKDYSNEYRIVRGDGSLRWVRAHGRFIYQDEKPVRMIGLLEDITEARQQIEMQRVLVAELQHRTRNLMAVVQSIATQTLHTVASLGEFEDQFNSRLDALSRVQSLLSRADNQPITLGAVVAMELEALALDAAGDRISFGGPEAPLRKSAVEMLSLAIHELLTNAIKYGALASDIGRLSVTWRIEGTSIDRCLALEWVERGISPLPRAADPGRSGGYGRMLIEEALRYSIGATTSYELGAEGLRCLISLPLSMKPTEEMVA